MVKLTLITRMTVSKLLQIEVYNDVKLAYVIVICRNFRQESDVEVSRNLVVV